MVRLQINCKLVVGCFKLNPQTPRVAVYSLAISFALVEMFAML